MTVASPCMHRKMYGNGSKAAADNLIYPEEAVILQKGVAVMAMPYVLSSATRPNTHVSKRTLMSVRNPLDNLFEEEAEKGNKALE